MSTIGYLPKSLVESATQVLTEANEDHNIFMALLKEHRGATRIEDLSDREQEELYAFLKKEGCVSEGYMGFLKLESKIKARGGVLNEGSPTSHYQNGFKAGRLNKKTREKSFKNNYFQAGYRDAKAGKEDELEGEKKHYKNGLPASWHEEKEGLDEAPLSQPAISKVAAKAWQIAHQQRRGTYGKNTGLKQTNEEPLDELSTKTLKSYLSKADKESKRLINSKPPLKSNDPQMRKLANRVDGKNTAYGKIKSRNEESLSESPKESTKEVKRNFQEETEKNHVADYKKKQVKGLYHYSHYEHPSGKFIQVRHGNSPSDKFVHYDGNKYHKFDNIDSLKNHVNKHHSSLKENALDVFKARANALAEALAPQMLAEKQPKKKVVCSNEEQDDLFGGNHPVQHAPKKPEPEKKVTFSGHERKTQWTAGPKAKVTPEMSKRVRSSFHTANIRAEESDTDENEFNEENTRIVTGRPHYVDKKSKKHSKLGYRTVKTHHHPDGTKTIKMVKEEPLDEAFEASLVEASNEAPNLQRLTLTQEGEKYGVLADIHARKASDHSLKAHGAKTKAEYDFHSTKAREHQDNAKRYYNLSLREEQELAERTLTPGEERRKEHNVMSMKKHQSEFKQRYGDRWKSVVYATATKQAKLHEEDNADKKEGDDKKKSDKKEIRNFPKENMFKSKVNQDIEKERIQKGNDPVDLAPVKGKNTMTGEKKDKVEIQPYIITSPTGDSVGGAQVKSGTT